MGFVNDHKVPWCGCDIGCLVAGEVVGADDDTVFDFEWAKVSLLDCLVVGFCFQYPAWQEELFRQFLVPLLRRLDGVMTSNRR